MLRCESSSRVGAISLALLLVLVPRDAHAQIFSPQSCSVCPSFTEIDWTYNSSELPTDPNCASGTCPHYINNIDHWRTVLANKWVKQFQFRVDAFSTELSYDYLDYGELGAQARLTGTPATGWWGVVSSDSVQKVPIDLRFRTDSSISRPGFSIGKARVCCSVGAPLTNPVPNRDLVPLERTTGVLLGGNDTVYATIPVGPSTQKRSISVWGPLGTDFDVYVRCNAAPTPTVWDYRGYSGDSQETIIIQQPGGCTYPGTWYVAINSYAGSGQFNIVTSPMYNADEISLRVGFNYAATTATINSGANALTQASRQFFGETEGQILIRQYDIWNNTGATCANCGGVACDICFMNQAGTGACCTGPNARLDLFLSYFSDPEGIAHEYGHRFLGVGDEYIGSGGLWQCGHSNMASPWGSQNNFCVVNDHARDYTPDAGPSPNLAVWAAAVSRMPTHLYYTGDNYDYRDHDFNGLITTVIH